MPTQKKILRTKWRAIAFGIVDVVATLLTLLVSALLTNRFTNENVSFNNEYVFVSLLVLIVWIILLKSTHLARIPRTSVIPVLLSDFFRLSLIGGMILLILDYVIRLDSFPSITILIFALLNCFTLFIIRLLTFRLFKKFRANGHNIKNIIIIADDDSISIIEKLTKQKEWGYNVIHVITDSEEIGLQFGKELSLKSTKTNIKALLRQEIIDEILCFNSIFSDEQLSDVIKYAHELGINVRIQGNLSIPSGYKTKVHYFNRIPFITVESNPINNFHYTLKAILEFSVAFVLLSILSPLLILLSMAIAFTSRGPIVYKQERIGLRGRKFYIYKFRTTYSTPKIPLSSTDIELEKVQTPIGKFICRFKLDFIPQFLNVIRGEMSLVGPKAPTPAELNSFEEWQFKLLSVNPGLTCTWQIAPDRTLNKEISGMKMDINYIENWSLKSDISLFLKTFLFVWAHPKIRR